MRRIALSLIALGAMLAMYPQAACASNARSWVASYGSNGNPCTLTQPCATFDVAITNTFGGGEINCIDQGEFSPGPIISITKPITIDCEGVQGRIGAISISGVSISVGPTETVVLRGLDISGFTGGDFGIAYYAGAALHVEKCIIHDFNSSGSSFGWGILVAPSTDNAVLKVYVSDTSLINNGTTSSGGGLLVQPNAVVNTITKVVLNRVEVRNNFFGIKADGTVANTSGGVINMTVRDSVSAGNTANGIVGTSSGNGPAIVMMVDRSASSHNGGYGVIAFGPLTTIRIGNMSIAGNATGAGTLSGGSVQSFKTNQIKGNSVDGTPLPGIGLD
ncbi:MAG: hypothetical protein JOZ40_10575 [Methylobacteriaceae bacterium]|nr:hypothetical protein [Methylobacteriaceae bacterium]